MLFVENDVLGVINFWQIPILNVLKMLYCHGFQLIKRGATHYYQAHEITGVIPLIEQPQFIQNTIYLEGFLVTSAKTVKNRPRHRYVVQHYLIKCTVLTAQIHLVLVIDGIDFPTGGTCREKWFFKKLAVDVDNLLEHFVFDLKVVISAVILCAGIVCSAVLG